MLKAKKKDYGNLRGDPENAPLSFMLLGQSSAVLFAIPDSLPNKNRRNAY